MKVMNLRLGIVVAGLLLTAGPVLAQRPEPGAGSDRGSAGSGGGGGGGGAVASGGGGGGGSVSSVGGGSSGGGGGVSSNSPSASGISSPSMSGGSRSVPRATAPEHRVSYSDAAGQRTRPAPSSGSNDGQRSAPRSATAGPGSSGGDRAVTRGAAAANGDGGRRAGESTANPNNANGTREIPNWSRPRGDRPVTDSAVTRVGPRPDRGGGGGNSGYVYDPYYYYGFGYGFGLYDRGYYGYPFYSPFGFGYGIPYGYFDPFYGDPYDYGAGYGAYSSRVYGGHDQGALKLKVKPRNAKVYVDGYYVGLVDEFDGAFQKLTLNGGRHKVELRAEGYETTEFDVLISPEQTVTFAGDMKKNQ